MNRETQMIKNSYLSKFFAIVVIFALALASCAEPVESGVRASDALSDIRASNTIRVGWAPYAPYVSADLNSRMPQGYYVDLVEAMAQEAGWQVEWVESTWGNMIADLELDRFDMMGAPVFRTLNRAKVVEFTDPIGFFGLSAVSRADSDYRSLDDFQVPGIKIAVTQGEVGQDYASRNFPEAELIVRQTGDISLALVDVLQGRADVGIADSWTISQFVAEHPGVLVDLYAEEPFNQVGAGWFVRPSDDDLRVFLNTSIDWLKSSGTKAKIAERYPDLPEVR